MRALVANLEATIKVTTQWILMKLIIKPLFKMLMIKKKNMTSKSKLIKVNIEKKIAKTIQTREFRIRCKVNKTKASRLICSNNNICQSITLLKEKALILKENRSNSFTIKWPSSLQVKILILLSTLHKLFKTKKIQINLKLKMEALMLLNLST
jgi:hypothetical protein